MLTAICTVCVHMMCSHWCNISIVHYWNVYSTSCIDPLPTLIIIWGITLMCHLLEKCLPQHAGDMSTVYWDIFKVTKFCCFRWLARSLESLTTQKFLHGNKCLTKSRTSLKIYLWKVSKWRILEISQYTHNTAWYKIFKTA